MKYSIALIMFLSFTLHAADTVIMKREYTIEYDDDDDDQRPIVFCFNQKCNVNNEQTTECTHPIVEIQQPQQPQEPTPAPVQPIVSWFSINDLVSPLNISIVGCLLGALYYLKTKLTLYSLSKACVEQAFWSLWQSKTTPRLMHDQDQDTTLLYDILQTYQTDQYAIAMARFLQDVDVEIELLHRYLEQAQKTQSGIMQFALPDMSNDIVETQARLAKLASLKQTVLAWLAHGATSL